MMKRLGFLAWGIVFAIFSYLYLQKDKMQNTVPSVESVVREDKIILNEALEVLHKYKKQTVVEKKITKKKEISTDPYVKIEPFSKKLLLDEIDTDIVKRDDIDPVAALQLSVEKFETLTTGDTLLLTGINGADVVAEILEKKSYEHGEITTLVASYKEEGISYMVSFTQGKEGLYGSVEAPQKHYMLQGSKNQLYVYDADAIDKIYFNKGGDKNDASVK